MINKPIIGIVGRPKYSKDNRKLIAIYEEVRRSIIRNGGIPILMLPSQDVNYSGTSKEEIGQLTEENKKDILKQILLCDGLLFQGGTRIFDYDKYIINAGIELDMPMLGICLGMQTMAKSTGGYLEKIKDSYYNHKQVNVSHVHDVVVTKNSKLVNIFNTQRIAVNSRHGYYVACPGEYKISALSSDGYVEAIEMVNNSFNIGVQWHPEDLVDSMPNNKLFEALIDNAKLYNNKNELHEPNKVKRLINNI